MAIVPVGLGHKGYVQWARETTYGTAPANSKAKFELISFTYSSNLNVLTDPSMNFVAMSPRTIVAGSQFHSGTVKLRLGIEGAEQVFSTMLPTYAFAQASAGPPQVNDHTMTEALTLNSYTMEVDMGEIPAAKVTRFTGVYITGMRVTQQAANGDGGMMLAELTWVAAAAVANSTALTGAATYTPYPVSFPMLSLTGAEFKDGSSNTAANIRIRNWELALTIPHKTDRLYLGSSSVDFPVRSGYFDVMLSMEQEWNDVTLQTNELAQAQVDLWFTWRWGTTYSSTYSRELEFRLRQSQPSEYSNAIPGFDVITQKAAFKAQYNTTDNSALKVRTRNALTTQAAAF